eukprot:3069802-Amphidinium_carterae.1
MLPPQAHTWGSLSHHLRLRHGRPVRSYSSLPLCALAKADINKYQKSQYSAKKRPAASHQYGAGDVPQAGTVGDGDDDAAAAGQEALTHTARSATKKKPASALKKPAASGVLSELAGAAGEGGMKKPRQSLTAAQREWVCNRHQVDQPDRAAIGNSSGYNSVVVPPLHRAFCHY